MKEEPLTKEQVEQRTQEGARALMSMPYAPRTKPKAPEPTPSRGGASKPGRRAPTGEAS